MMLALFQILIWLPAAPETHWEGEGTTIFHYVETP
jgi:hypothetical protein